MAGIEKNQPVELAVNGKAHVFDIDNAALPDWIDKEALASGGFPYDKKLDADTFDRTLEKLQIELVKVQFWLQATGRRVVAIFEGRDAAASSP
jgi:polyphosphate kinase 2 (PPK2 family)